MDLSPAISGLIGLGIAFLAIPLILRLVARAPRLNRPVDWHHTERAAVPRLGGIALALSFIGVETFIALVYPERRAQVPGRNLIVFSSLAMLGLGLWDDFKPLGAKKKFLGQVLIAASICCFGLGIQVFKVPFTGHIVPLGGWGVLITILWLVGMTNLINLIDGVDGLAGGISLMLMILLAFVGHRDGNLGLLACGMAGALLGFLWFNFPPARIYMGDGGAYFLGFQIGIFSLVNSHKGTVFAALVAPLFVLALPIVDTCLAILRRGLRGLPIFRPDRRHLHHKLLNLGLSRRRVILWIYALTLVFLLMGLLAYWSRGQMVPVLLGGLVLILLFCAGKLSFCRDWFAVGRMVGNSLGMRRQVRYALSLTRWLEMEGHRHSSVESLWSDFAFAAGKLGFASAKLILEDGERTWIHPGECESGLGPGYRFQDERCGNLELRVPRSPRVAEIAGRANRTREADGEAGLPNPRLFELTSELLAEAWVKAARPWAQGQTAPLRFDAKVRPPERPVSDRWLASLPFARRPQPSGSTSISTA